MGQYSSQPGFLALDYLLKNKLLSEFLPFAAAATEFH